MGTLTLEGGRYDGWTFQSEGGWTPGPDVGALYIERPDPAAWSSAVSAVQSPAIVTTMLVGVGFCARKVPTPFDKILHNWEAYHRCPDGRYRVPGLARCS